MSSDPFADLAKSLDVFCTALHEAMNDHPLAQEGSPAAKESAGEPLAGEWGERPSGDIAGAVLLTANSCIDHLFATAAVISRGRSVTALYTLVRASAEAASAAYHLLDPSIDAKERVRRGMNWRLSGLSEEINLIRGLDDPSAVEAVRRNHGRIEQIGRAAKDFGLQFRKPDGPRAAYLLPRPQSATQLVGACMSDVPGQGAAYLRLLSGVAHAQPHGLTRLVRAAPPGTDQGVAGERMMQVNLVPGRAALDLFAGPACAHRMVYRLFPFMGWEFDDVESVAKQMMYTWHRIAN